MKKDWKVEKIGDVCEVIAGQSPEGTYYNDKGKGLPFYQGKKEFTEKFIGEPTTWTTKVTKEAQAGDILMSVRAPVGPVNFATQKICIGRGLAAIRAGTSIDKEFLFYFLLKHEEEIEGNAGAVFSSINKTQIESIEIPIPSLPEQQRIVSLLDETFAGLAQVHTNAERNLVNAREVFEAALEEIFDNGVDWLEKKLHEIGDTQTGTTPKTSESENYGDFIPFIKPADIDIWGNGEIRYDNEGLSEVGISKGRLMPEGSVLMVCIGASIGKVGFADREVSCNQQINTLSVNKGLFPKFFYYAMRTKSFYNSVIKNSAQATLPIINKGKWENLKVSFPESLEEQRAIVERLDALAAETSRLETVYQSKLEAVEELRKSVLGKAFEGNL